MPFGLATTQEVNQRIQPLEERLDALEVSITEAIQLMKDTQREMKKEISVYRSGSTLITEELQRMNSKMTELNIMLEAAQAAYNAVSLLSDDVADLEAAVEALEEHQGAENSGGQDTGPGGKPKKERPEKSPYPESVHDRRTLKKFARAALGEKFDQFHHPDLKDVASELGFALEQHYPGRFKKLNDLPQWHYHADKHKHRDAVLMFDAGSWWVLDFVRASSAPGSLSVNLQWHAHKEFPPALLAGMQAAGAAV